MSFTAHNIRLPDGTFTAPEIGWLIADSPWLKAAARVLRLIYPGDMIGRSIIDLGCLEGGYTVEFARMGMQALGIEVRQSNFTNCLDVKDKIPLPNLRFAKDDVWNLGSYGNFSAAFCCGLLYHLDRPAAFLRLLGAHTQDAVIINTHYAREKECASFALSPMTENEGLPGRWFSEHDTEDEKELETLKWSAWSNKQSFWLTKSGIFQVLQECGFDMCFEQADFLGSDIRSARETGYYATHSRSMFVGIRTGIK